MNAQAAHAPRQRTAAGWLLWVVLAATWLASLPVRPLLDPDEGRYAEIPREMWQSGDWVTPRLDGLKYFEKPPLQYWGTAAIYSVFGLSEWTARLWSVGLALLCLPLVFGWTARLYGREAGLAALTALAASPYYELIGHLNLLDPAFAFWMAGTMFAFALGMAAPEGSAEERRWVLLAWAGAALAVLSKGIVVAVLAGGTLVLYSGLERDWRPWRRLQLLWGIPLFMLMAAPWFVAVSERNATFVQFFFVHEHFARFLTTVHQRVEPWWYFVVLLLVGCLPWLKAGAEGSVAAWQESSSDRTFKPLKFILIFSIFTILFFSLSGSKLAPYILPMMPAAAVIAGVARRGHPQFVREVARFTAALVVILASGFAFYAYRRFGFIPAAAAGWLIASGVIALGGALLSRHAPGFQSRPVILGCATAILAWQCLLCAYSVLPIRSPYKMITAIQPLVHPGTRLFSVGQYRPTVSAYLARTFTLVDFEGELAFGLSEEPALALAPDAFLREWKASRDAIAFIDPVKIDEWRRRGLRGRVIGGDDDTVVIARP